jgi:hypothetical protein
MSVNHRGYGPLTADDVRYIRASYVTLAAACAGRCDVAEARARIRDRSWPAASYVLDEGTEMVPRDYFALIDGAGDGGLRAAFVARYAVAMRASGALPDERHIEAEWEAFLGGVYGVCLKTVTPEAIFEKESLVRSAGALLAQPASGDPRWRGEIRAQVDRLDALLRDFAPCDRARFGGSVSRDRVVTAARSRYPDVFREAGVDLSSA